MRNLLANKEKIYLGFAEAVNHVYREMRYGIQTATPDPDLDLYSMRKELVDWQSVEDAGALETTNIQYQTWLPVTYDDVVYTKGGNGYNMTNNQIGPQRVAVNYTVPGSNSSQNIIEVNSGGCITRINLNPSITINQNSSYVFSQNTPSTVWDIVHNMNMIPNVTVQDLLGDDIQGQEEVIDNNRLKIYFNTPVAGKAYLS